MLSNLATGKVGGHDENCILALQSLALNFQVTLMFHVVKIDHLSICETALIKKLEQCRKYIWVSLVHLSHIYKKGTKAMTDLVKKHHSLGVGLESLSQLTPILMTHITRWTSY